MAMASLFILASSLLALVVKSQTSICIWDRYNDANSNTHFNGLFVYDGEFDGVASYKKVSPDSTCGGTLYLYYVDVWTIHSSKDKNASSAICMETEITDCVANTWVTVGSTAYDSHMRAISGSCPYWNCGEISTNEVNRNCGSFTENIGVNAWKASNGYVWYFNPSFWQWMCINDNTYNYKACSGWSYELTTAQSWQDSSIGQTKTFGTGWSIDGLSSIVVQCKTTSNPTTPRPASAPTLQPVPTPQPVLPTQYPTTPTASSGDTVCLWGRYNDANFNTHLNGLFVYNGSSYKKSKAPNCGTDVYIYNIWNQWVIGESPGVNSWYASCSQASLTACVANTWTVIITQSTSELDPNLRVISGACPYWNCGRITTNSANRNCDEFGTNIGVNAWQSSTGFIWHFNPVYWSWFCLNANQDYLCTTSSQFITNKLWLDASLGGSTSLTTGTTSLIVQCLPTTNPTTPQPTARPTVPSTPVTSPTMPVTAPVSSGDTVCIWDRYNTNHLHTTLNGLYTYDGLLNGRTSYKKGKPNNCGINYWIWYYYGRWIIGTVKGQSSGWFAMCAQSDLHACVAGQWDVRLDLVFEIDTSMRIINGACPYWNCGRITTTSSDTNCQTFNTNIGVNTWLSSSGYGYVWYFNSEYWSWRCVNSANDHLCSNETAFSLTSQWVDMSLSSSRTMSTSTGSAVTVSCLPTSNPTTPQPTPKPTERPTSRPTPKPVVNPVPTPRPVYTRPPTPSVTPSAANPANNPAYIPITPVVNPAYSPVTNPNYNPAIYPGYTPVVNPSNSPVTNPNYSSAANPTENPSQTLTNTTTTSDSNDIPYPQSGAVTTIQIYNIFVFIVASLLLCK